MDGAGPLTILKRDALGRVTVTREQREALLDEFERGGLKGKPFARLVGVNYPTFASWIQKRRHARGDYAARAARSTPGCLPQPGALRLVEAVVPQALSALPEPADVASRALEVLLPGGAKVLVADARQAALAAQLLNSLRASSSC
jgi:hypothetical protein